MKQRLLSLGANFFSLLLAFTRSASRASILPWPIFQRKGSAATARQMDSEGADGGERHSE